MLLKYSYNFISDKTAENTYIDAYKISLYF